MKAKDLSKKIYDKIVKTGRRGYRLEYLEDGNKKVTLEGLTLIEKNGAEAYLTIADVVTYLFMELDLAIKEENVAKSAKTVKKTKKKVKK